jgi:putative endonuclease
MRETRVRAYRSSLAAETGAALMLRLKGHRIVAQRYKMPVGEIDLVALKNRRLAFIEVKRRKTAEDAARTVPAQQQRRRIARAAQIGWPAILTFRAMKSPSTWCSPPWAWPRYISNGLPRLRLNSPLPRLCL